MTARPVTPDALVEARRYLLGLYLEAAALVRRGEHVEAAFYIELASELLGAVGAKGEPS
ncbi:MAG: hypothetical protein L6Q84_24435 [Polyangiaceae bacterium]|nr:hypothetical protein [Polyangiaceae bacterium]